VPAVPTPPDIASASAPDTLAALHVSAETGLTHAEVDVRRKEAGYNEVAEKKGHPVLEFLGKFWGISAWTLEPLLGLLSIAVMKIMLVAQLWVRDSHDCALSLRLRTSHAQWWQFPRPRSGRRCL
jgi:magnesium-transporting ATPase (P-type)